MKKTILFRVIQGQDAYLQNMGFDETDIIKLFKKLKGFEPEDNGFEISNDELTVIMNNVVTNGEVIGIYNYSNPYNKDQSDINKIKRKYEFELKSRGYNIIEHCEWQPKFDTDKLETIINERNYLTNIIEQTKKKHSELLDKINRLKHIEDEINTNQKELDDINKTITKNKNEIINYKEEIEAIKSLYNTEQEKFDKLVERYKKGQKCLEEQREKLPEDIKKLKDEIDKLIEQKERIISDTKKCNGEIQKIENEKQYSEQELDRIKQQIKECNQLKEKIINITLGKLSSKLLEIKSPDEKLEEVKQKFIGTVKMYLLNNMVLPQFERDFAESYGLDKQTIQKIIDFVETTKI